MMKLEKLAHFQSGLAFLKKRSPDHHLELSGEPSFSCLHFSVHGDRPALHQVLLLLPLLEIFNAPVSGVTCHYAPVLLSRFGHYVVPTLLTPTFRRNWCWFRVGATLCHDVLRCCHAVATLGPRYCPVSTRLTSDTGKFSDVVLRYVTLPPRCSFAAATFGFDLDLDVVVRCDT